MPFLHFKQFTHGMSAVNLDARMIKQVNHHRDRLLQLIFFEHQSEPFKFTGEVLKRKRMFCHHLQIFHNAFNLLSVRLRECRCEKFLQGEEFLRLFKIMRGTPFQELFPLRHVIWLPLLRQSMLIERIKFHDPLPNKKAAAIRIDEAFLERCVCQRT